MTLRTLPARMFAKVRRVSAAGLYRLTGRWDNNFRPVFICGIAGSGTTLLTALLDQRYKVAANLPESALEADAGSSLHIGAIQTYATLAQYRAALPLDANISAIQLQEDCIRLYRRAVKHPKRGNTVLDKAPNTHLARAGALAQAFPEALFVLIVRNPITSIEGLRRKWPLFEQASIAENCDFWGSLHETFARESEAFRERLMTLTFDGLIAAPDDTIAAIAAWAGLKARPELRAYEDRPNQPGKGLRNVVEGEIRTDADADAKALARLDPAAANEIRTRLWAQFARYRHLNENQI